MNYEEIDILYEDILKITEIWGEYKHNKNFICYGYMILTIKLHYEIECTSEDCLFYELLVKELIR